MPVVKVVKHVVRKNICFNCEGTEPTVLFLNIFCAVSSDFYLLNSYCETTLKLPHWLLTSHLRNLVKPPYRQTQETKICLLLHDNFLCSGYNLNNVTVKLLCRFSALASETLWSG